MCLGILLPKSDRPQLSQHDVGGIGETTDHITKDKYARSERRPKGTALTITGRSP